MTAQTARRGQPVSDASSAGMTRAHRGRYLTLIEAAELYPVFTARLLRRLVQQRRIAFSRAGRVIVLAERDIEAYLERNRVEPVD